MKKFAVLLLPLLAMPGLAHAFTRVGVGIGIGVPFGYPLWTPEPNRVVIEQATIPAPPGPGYVWVPADWVFSNNTWTAAPAHWEIPPEPNAIWTAGHWELESNRWVWVNGYWAVPTPPPAPAAPPPPPPPPAPPPPPEPAAHS